MNVVLDTNALMMPAQFNVDLFEGLRELMGSFTALVPAEVVYELRGLSAGNSKKSVAAKFGLTLVEHCRILPEMEDDIPVDDKVVKAAREFNAVVVTNDRILKEKLLELRVPVVVLRSRSRLELIGK